MTITIDARLLKSIFTLPGSDGRYSPELQKYFGEIARRHPVILFSFPPKCGGTFLRAAAVTAVRGQLYRASYTQGGGEMQFYLPTFLGYYVADQLPMMVTHVHMQARESCRNFIRLLNLKTVMMVRSIPDMLVSYRDQFLREEGAMRENMICDIPEDFPQWTAEKQADFMIYMVAPWYFSYFSTWFSFAGEEPERIKVLQYDQLREQPAETLMAALEHFGQPQSREICQLSIQAIWEQRGKMRYNKGVPGRGREFFNAEHFRLLEKMLEQYPGLKSHHDELL